MSDHYNWSCDCCNTHGDIYDDDYGLTLSKLVYHPFGGKSGRSYITVCAQCDQKIIQGSRLHVFSTEQTVEAADVIKRT
jgi:hypothetical protein